MIGRSLVDELSEDREQDEKIVKSFYAKDSLSQDIFQGTKMIDSVRDRLLSITDNFIDFLGVDFFVYDVVLTGSLANYNWSEFSDIDLHVIIDYDESGHKQDLLKEFFDAKRAVWNASHDIKIKNYEVELYVQDIKEKHISSGVYTILNNEWIIEPQKEKKEIDDRKILEKGEEYAKLIDKLSKKQDPSEIDDVKKKLKRFRQTGLEDGGEYSYENLTFKLLRRNGYIEKLMNLKKKVTDKQYSVNEFEEFINGEEDICESVEFDYKDIRRFEKEAIKLYGTSDSFNQAVGFISPNGYLLDFGEGTGVRGQDHRNIGYVFDLLPDIDIGEYNGDKWKHEVSWGLYAAMDMGFIRYLPESQGIDMHQMPTQQQFEKIHQLIQKYNGRIIVEMNEEAYVEYEKDTPEDFIIDGIKAYYREGIKPKLYSDTEDNEMFLDREMDEDVMSQGKQQMFGITDDDAEMEKKAERYVELEKLKGEQPFGYIHRYDWHNVMAKFPVYKNPKSLNNFDGEVRAIADKDGNLYVAKDNGPFTHDGMSEVLLIPDNAIYNQMDDYPLLNRVGSTNDFGLSDSTAEYIRTDRVDMRNVSNVLQLTKKKNPQYGFYLEDYRKIGPQHKRI